jgi:hypothetical protein
MQESANEGAVLDPKAEKGALNSPTHTILPGVLL